ncbi:MAG TPA: hypothetical protein VMT16_07460 [Thermoanaerobaculia bacterium]|nr:hypothetical protein [Thermoanaerobaculia bacterium]
MSRKLMLTVAAALLAVAPAMAALPFGSFDGLAGGNNSGSGVLGVTGWALDDDGVSHVDIYVDGVIAGRAHYGSSRPEVRAMFPGYPDSAAAGFGFLLDTTHYNNGLHVVSARVSSDVGERVWLQDVAVQFVNTTQLLAPFGKITFPNKHSVLRGACDLNDELRRFQVIQGIALDAGAEEGHHDGPPGQDDPPGDSGVGWVELLIDGSIWANTRVDCEFDPARGGLSDCYGLPSLGWEQLYPTLPDSPNAGFRFVLDIGFLIDFGYVPGHHVLTVRAGDIVGNVRNIDQIVVQFMCDEFLDNEPSVGRIGVPPKGPIYAGTIQILGWAIDFEGVSRVDVYANGALMGTAFYGFPRPGVPLIYPGYPGSAFSGYAFLLDTLLLPDGWNDIQVVVVDVFGRSTMIGERTIFINNDF